MKRFEEIEQRVRELEGLKGIYELRARHGNATPREVADHAATLADLKRAREEMELARPHERIAPQIPAYADGSTPAHGRGRTTATPSTEWRDSHGNPVFVLRPEERMCDLPTQSERGTFGPGALGRLLRAMACNNPQHARDEIRALGEGSNIGGGVMVPDELSSQLIDLARNKAVLLQAGAQTVPMQSETLRLAKVLSDPTVSVAGENDLIAESEPTFGSVLLNAYKLGCYCTMSRELAEDAPNAGELLQSQLAAAMAQQWDALALTGTGSAQPLGVTNYPGIGTVTSHGSVATNYFDKLLDAVEDIEEANGSAATWLAPPAVWTFFRKLKSGDGDTSALAYLPMPEPFASMQRLSTNQAPSGVSVIGDFSTVLMGVRRNILVESTAAAGETFQRDQVAFKVTFRGDIALTHPQHIVVVDGMTL